MSLILSTILTGIGLGLGFAIGDNIIRHSVEAFRNWREIRQFREQELFPSQVEEERWQEIDQRRNTPDIYKQMSDEYGRKL